MDPFLSVLGSKLFWGILGPVLAAVAIYYKGRRDESKERENAQHEAREELRRQVLEAEKKNLNKERSRDRKINIIDSTSADKLIELWGKNWGKEDRDKSSD